MYAIAFDLTVADAALFHPESAQRPYAGVGAILAGRGFNRVQGSLYVTDNEDVANLFSAIMELRARPWFPKSVRDIRASRIEQWSDFTPLVEWSASRRARTELRDERPEYANDAA